MISRLVGALLAVLFTCGIAAAKMPGGTGTTYYVSSAGSDSNNGTSTATPWLTMAKVNAATFGPGDTILFQGTFTNIQMNIYGTAAGGHFGGTSLNPITIGPYGSGATFIPVANGQCFVVKDTGGIIIGNITCTGNGTNSGSTNGYWFGLYNDTNTTTYDFIYVHDMVGTRLAGGLDAETMSNSRTGFSNVSFVNISLTNFAAVSGSSGMFFCDCTNVGNYAFKNVFISGLNLGQFTADGVDLWNVQGGVLQKSYIHDSQAISNSTSAVQTNQSNGLVISRNEVSNQGSALDGFDACGIDVDGTSMNVMVSYNWVHDNAGCGISLFQGAAGAPWSANTIAYNTTQNNATGNTNVKAEITIGSAAQNGMSGLSVIGNTFYTSIGAANANACVQFNAANITGIFANNICYTTANPRAIDAVTFNPTTLQFQGNDYFGSTKVRWNNVSYTTIALWRAAVTSEETYRGADTSLVSDPLLTGAGAGGTCFTSGIPAGPQPCPSAYLLQAGSPMLNAGQNLPNVFGIQPGARDYFGNIVPAPSNGNYDVGANQKTQ